MDSAVFRGGYPALMAAVVIACVLVLWLPSSMGNGRLRIAAFFVLWQAFTPVWELHVDIPRMLGAMVAMELGYRWLSSVVTK